MTEVGTRAESARLYLTEGDRLTLTVRYRVDGDGTRPALSPRVEFWWPSASGGQALPLVVSEDGTTATLALTAAQVGILISDLEASPGRRPQVDIGTEQTIVFTPTITHTHRPNVEEEALG